MPKIDHYVVDGLKAVNLESLPEEAWEYLSGGENKDDTRKFYSRIPWLYRGVELRAGGVASLPFQILNDAGDVVDQSTAYENKIGFIPDPERLLWLIEACLTIAGNAYLFNGLNAVGATKEVRYLVPTTIKPKFSDRVGLVGFERRLKGNIIPFQPEDIIYFWRPDYNIEIGPAASSPALAAAQACGVMLSIDEFAAYFFERGAIRATILGVPQATRKEERDKLKRWYQRVMAGISNAFSTEVISADAVTPTVIGEGIKELENTELTKEKREDIATALGIPHSLLFSNAANFATAKQDDLNFYKKTIEPDAKLIQSTLNKQLLEPMGYQITFIFEALEIFQEEEVQRSAAFVNLSQYMPPTVAMQILGFDPPTDLTWEQLESTIDEYMQKQREQGVSLVNTPDPTANRSMPPKIDQENGSNDHSLSELEIDLDKWERKSINHFKREGSALVGFKSEHIPAALTSAILGGLELAETKAEIKRTFKGAKIWYQYP